MRVKGVMVDNPSCVFVSLFLEFKAITNRRNNREQAGLHQDFLLLMGVFVEAVTRIYQERIVVVVSIVDAEIPGADAVFLLLVEVHAHVETVIIGHSEVVAFEGLDVRDVVPVG